MSLFPSFSLRIIESSEAALRLERRAGLAARTRRARRRDRRRLARRGRRPGASGRDGARRRARPAPVQLHAAGGASRGAGTGDARRGASDSSRRRGGRRPRDVRSAAGRRAVVLRAGGGDPGLSARARPHAARAGARRVGPAALRRLPLGGPDLAASAGTLRGAVRRGIRDRSRARCSRPPRRRRTLSAASRCCCSTCRWNRRSSSRSRGG